jgi:hypothetical protein
MRSELASRTTFLAILSLPAAAIGYFVSAAVLSGLPLPPDVRDALTLFVPLFVAAVCMVPFLLPLFDRMAKRDLETYRAQSTPDAEEDPPRPEA